MYNVQIAGGFRPYLYDAYGGELQFVGLQKIKKFQKNRKKIENGVRHKRYGLTVGVE